MDQTIEEFFHDFHQELLAGAEANSRFLLSEFMETLAAELVDTGVCEGFELCHYRASRGMRVDGYWFNDEGVLDLFIADSENSDHLSSLTKTDIDVLFKRLSTFFEACIQKDLYENLEVTSPEFGLARQIIDRKNDLHQLNLILFSKRSLSQKIQSLPDNEICGITTKYHVWDISRLQRQRSSRGQKEPLFINFKELFGSGVACLPAHLKTDNYRSYLIVMPAEILANLYEKFGARLLEQNVRTFLQARGNVNQGIRSTIINEPGMFFAYNNGITATAQDVVVTETDSGIQISEIKDLQIVNGGQTTASLFHTKKRDKADLSEIFVQMKLSVIDSVKSETVVPKISEYANTQNKVSTADFFSNHPFHIRMEDFSRRLWAPAQQGAQRETRWFYERARGQYADAQSTLSPAEQRRFKAENPKPQMLTKTDLAKFENVWDDNPKWVNLGSQKNFSRYASRIGSEWEQSSDSFNEFYFKRAVARAILFKAAERIISSQPWYGGYRANIVAYTLASIAEITKRRNESIDFMAIWNKQSIPQHIEQIIVLISKIVAEDIINPPSNVSNISEWCKKEACWTRIQNLAVAFSSQLPKAFYDSLISSEMEMIEKKSAKKTQQIDNGIEAQKKVFNTPAEKWTTIRDQLFSKNLLDPKEDGILKIAMQIPSKIPSENQCKILLELLEKAKQEGCYDEA